MSHSASAAAASDDLILPSPPQALAALVQEASKPDAQVPALARLCASDPAFSVELLRLVNSPVYSRGAKITAVAKAVSVVGVRTLRNLALCTAARGCVDARRLRDFPLDRFWEDSLRRAVAAQILAERCHKGSIDPTEAFTMGLIQDLGLVALAMHDPAGGTAWGKGIAENADTRRQAEQEIFGRAHDVVGARLAEAWALPPELAAPMAFHHDPSRAAPALRERCQLARQAEVLAEVLSRSDKRVALEAARRVLGDELGMAATEQEAVVEQLGQRVTAVASALGIKVGVQPTLESVLQAANRGLVEMNLSYEDLVRQLEQTLAEKDELTAKLAARNRELEQLSVTDALTNLPNRRAFSGRLSYEIGRAARSGAPLALLVGDIDKFKSVNDTWGHEFGDRVLQAVGVVLGGLLRETDMVARIGGEEFALVLPETPREGALTAARKVLQALRDHTLVTPTGEVRAFTISLGLAMVAGQATVRFDGDEVGMRLYKAADRALYASKSAGRDRVTELSEPVPWAAPAPRPV